MDNIGETGNKVQESPSLEVHSRGCLCRCKQRFRIIGRVPGPYRRPPPSSSCPRLRRLLLFDPRDSSQRKLPGQQAQKILSLTVFWGTRLGARGRSTFSELRWYPPVEAAKGLLSWIFRAE